MRARRCHVGVGHLGALAPRRRQGFGLGHEQREEFAHDAARLAHHAVDAVVAVHALEQEFAERLLAFGDIFGEGGERLAQRPHLFDAAGFGGGGAAGEFGDKVCRSRCR